MVSEETEDALGHLWEIDVEPRLAESVRINEVDIQSDYIDWAKQASYWNERWASAYQDFRTAEAERKQIEDSLVLDPQFIDGVATELGKKPTVAQLEAAVRLSKKYRSAKQRELLADVEHKRLRNLLDILHGKREALISLGAHQRQEYKGDPTLR